MKKILVTGADGFLGRNLIRELIKQNYEIYALVYKKQDYNVEFEYNENVHVAECDLLASSDDMLDIPSGIDVMYHLAWYGVDAGSRKNMDIQMKNIQLSINCIEIAKKKRVKRIIIPGSTNEYLYCGGLINSNSAPCPKDAYGSVKTATQFLCRQMAKEYGIEFIYAIITGIYAEEREDNNVIFYVIKSLLKGESPSLTRLEQEWDYIYIDDVVSALILLGEKGVNGKIYAVGRGDNVPLRNYIEIIHKKINSNLSLGIGDISYDNDILPSSCMDISELQKDTGFEPKVKFENGIDRVIEKLRRKYGSSER